ncbi:MAG: 50S ribosomal protein L1 [Spirochaetia bacterium]|nr:50S ribosomal protein L1 [Spirochaetota bacterium]MCX8096366.1 50S ribosomal protein L1 [Spirochaetota bacterium]MDW8113050.1 50S ribosomal protein L1 [Spirochaetia bacterium]
MSNRSKRYTSIVSLVDKEKSYALDEALDVVIKSANAKFDESIDVAIKTGIKQGQSVRGSVSLPHGTGRQVKVLVFAKGDKAKEAREAGADYVGAEDLIDKILKEQWVDYDVVIATPDIMKDVSKLGPILGRKKLMPNPKVGTVTFDIAKAVQEFKKGKLEFRTDKTGNIHVSVGKKSMGKDKLRDNILVLVREVVKARPSDYKGEFVKNISISSTMGPGVKVNRTQVIQEANKVSV